MAQFYNSFFIAYTFTFLVIGIVISLYLYEFLDFKKKLDKVREEHYEMLEAGYFPDAPVFVEAEYEILKETGGYPEDLMEIIKKSA